eukprot:428063-Ditylum_brightwellii.AAC.1
MDHNNKDNKPFSYLVCVKERCIVDILLCLCAHILSNAMILGMGTRKEHKGDTLQAMCQPKADLK